MKINLIKIFLLGVIVNVVCVERNWVYGDLLEYRSHCFLQCLSIEGHEKDEKKCKELNAAVENLIQVLCRDRFGMYCSQDYDNVSCSQAYDNVSSLWKRANQYDSLFNLFGLMPKLRDTSFKKYIEKLKQNNYRNTFVLDKWNNYFND